MHHANPKYLTYSAGQGEGGRLPAPPFGPQRAERCQGYRCRMALSGLAVEAPATLCDSRVVPLGATLERMTPEIALLLAEDGIANGAIYVLVGLGIVLVFVVTRVVFVPYGDILAYAALTLGTLERHRLPGTVWLVLTLALIASAVEIARLWRENLLRELPRSLALFALLPLLPAVAVTLMAGRDLPAALAIALTLALV